KLVKVLGNRRKIAGFLYGLVLVAIVAVPMILMISKVINSFHGLHEIINSIKEHHVPPLPEKISSLPYVGEKAQNMWNALEDDPKKATEMYGPQVKAFLQHMISAGGGIIGAALELIIGIIISAVVLTVGGNKVVEPLVKTLKTLTGEKQGMELVDASGRAIRGVAIGVMGTGLIAALLAWLGYAIAGIETAALLAAITFFLVVIQLGPALVVIPVVIYLAQSGQTGWAIFVGVYGLVVLMSVDNILKPILISRSGKLPVLVLFLGVVGGMTAWGFTGMFKGAIVMALFYTLIQGWIKEEKTQEAALLETK
ncbi:MAG: AI-2E family transporter, partial [Chitinophagaceae bacterium]|nr:AI-2E family transporter [Chitinophagaceae bacterium]